MPLKDYKNKRNFKKTPEPGVEKKKTATNKSKKQKPQGSLEFVVHKHFASRLHYDLRLELDGVLKSWAIPKGPTMNPEDKRLAVMVEDHPYDYGDFEGIIPEGNYGAGKVYIWDKGSYHSRNATGKDDSSIELREGLANGHITFILEGEILKGEFALVKLKKASQKDWLMIKKNDEFATDADLTRIEAPNERLDKKKMK
jgi:bifunctional non-homologous end joining protein LigD